MKLKTIKLENKEYATTILDLLRLLDPSKTGKFMTLLLNELKFYNKSVPLGSRNIRLLSHPIKTLDVVHEELLEILIECLGGSDIINDLEKFEVLSEENLISIKDIQEYKSLGELSLAVIDAEEKRKDKNCSPHKEIVLDHPDYLILKPLNVFASKKYGASTKWCTSSKDPKTFYQYSEKGILIYILSKLVNESKWAVYYDMDLKELSWWNAKDILTDGYLVTLPEKLKKDILKYILNEEYPNNHYFNEKTNLNSKEILSIITEEYLDVDGDNIDVLCEPAIPSPLNVVWPPGINPNEVKYEPTTTASDERIDSMVRKTLEYHYTISALNKGGEEMS